MRIGKKKNYPNYFPLFNDFYTPIELASKRSYISFFTVFGNVTLSQKYRIEFVWCFKWGFYLYTLYIENNVKFYIFLTMNFFFIPMSWNDSVFEPTHSPAICLKFNIFWYSTIQYIFFYFVSICLEEMKMGCFLEDFLYAIV